MAHFYQVKLNSCSASDFLSFYGKHEMHFMFPPKPLTGFGRAPLPTNRHYTRKEYISSKDSKLASHNRLAVGGGLQMQTNGNLTASTRYAKHTRALPIFLR